MTNSEPYPYSHRALLEERYDYMYTPYAGPSFLQAYTDDRLRLLEKLRAAASGDPACGSASDEAHIGTSLGSRAFAILPSRPRGNSFDTMQLLLDLWQCHLHGPDEVMEGVGLWEEALLGRFEITKRLYSQYSASLRPESQDATQLEPYALLSGLLMRRYSTTPNLRFLNAVLKLNDLLSSARIEEYGVRARVPTLIAVEAELAAMETLIAAHGVTL